MSIKRKLLIVFIVLALLQTLVISYIYYSISSSIAMNMEIRDKQYKINAVEQEINKILQAKQFIGINYNISNTIQQILKEYNRKDGELTVENQLELRRILTDYNIIGNSLSSVKIYMPDNTVFNATNTSFSVQKNSCNYKDILDYVGIKTMFRWDSVKEFNGEYVISYLRPLKSMDNSSALLGILELNLKETELYHVYDSMESQEDGNYFVLNDQGIILSAKDKAYLGENLYLLFDIKKEEMNSEFGSMEQNINKDTFLITYQMDPGNQWKYVNIVSQNVILKKLQYLQDNTILIVIVIITVCALIAIIVANSISAPIKKLTAEMKKAESGDLITDYSPKSQDEVGQLGQSYVSMIKSLDRSIKQIYIEQEAKREAELKALEYQINPHFLYNTFSLLIWQIDAGDKEDAIKTTNALSNIFSISINKEKGLISIEEEMKYLTSYLDIQKSRFMDKFQVYYDIDYDITKFLMPKIILQPIVENAMVHGILKNKTSNGRIIIHGGKNEKGIEFIIKDNGGNMTQQEVDALNEYIQDENAAAKEYGIGIKNVDKRIYLKYGRRYGVEFFLENNFTCVRISLPEIRKDDSNG